jgi:hypothetical protein
VQFNGKATDMKAIQDYYPDQYANCFGCGRNNAQSMHIKTYWDGHHGCCHFEPLEFHSGYAGVMYGGLIASLIECNSVAVSIAATCDREGRDMDSMVTEAPIFFTIARSILKYRSVIPLNAKIFVKTSIDKLNRKLGYLSASVFAGNKVCTTAEVVTARVPAEMIHTKFTPMITDDNHQSCHHLPHVTV